MEKIKKLKILLPIRHHLPSWDGKTATSEPELSSSEPKTSSESVKPYSYIWKMFQTLNTTIYLFWKILEN